MSVLTTTLAAVHTPSPEELEQARLQGADDAVATCAALRRRTRCSGLRGPRASVPRIRYAPQLMRRARRAPHGSRSPWSLANETAGTSSSSTAQAPSGNGVGASGDAAAPRAKGAQVVRCRRRSESRRHGRAAAPPQDFSGGPPEAHQTDQSTARATTVARSWPGAQQPLRCGSRPHRVHGSDRRVPRPPGLASNTLAGPTKRPVRVTTIEPRPVARPAHEFLAARDGEGSAVGEPCNSGELDAVEGGRVAGVGRGRSGSGAARPPPGS